MTEQVKTKTSQPEADPCEDLELQLSDTFPASDPPSINQPGVRPGQPIREGESEAGKSK